MEETDQTAGSDAGPLTGLRILDLTRIMAGPTCTQLLGDLGADVIKIERPGAGDDTRKWGPPYVTDADGRDTQESAYYLSCNRNKRSLTLDIARPEGAALVRRLLARCDVLIHNFKVGGLEKYGLGYEQLHPEFPGLVYCAITGFGQTGPYAKRAGYDYLAQAMGGIMSITGPADGPPMKVGVAIADVMCGMYASSAILAALRHRDRTGEGQSIDLGLLDAQVSWLMNEASNYLTSGRVPQRRGSAHPNIVPYQVFETADGNFVLAVGNDAQYRRFCEFAGHPEWGEDPRFVTNSARLANRETLCAMIEEVTRRQTSAHWLDGLEALGVPASPVNDIGQVFEDPQVRHRGMKIAMAHPLAGAGTVDLVGNPIKLSGTPVTYRRAPPTLGQHTDEVLAEVLDLDEAARAALRRDGII
jgi:crotonobetainyl-CoA:carnitine CoA-transferase CaiB-like acyl-CoA transferase